jgi:hypothetical protein
MNATYTTSLPARFAAFAVALLTSAVVLGSTVSGMQPRSDDFSQVVALERITITATRTN